MKLLLANKATVHIIDLVEPDEEEPWKEWPNFHLHKADTRDWIQLSDAFTEIDVMNYVFANAGLGGLDDDLLVDQTDDTGRLMEPKFLEVETNIRGVCNTSEYSKYGDIHNPNLVPSGNVPKPHIRLLANLRES